MLPARVPPRSYYLGGDRDESATADEVVDQRSPDWLDTGLVDENGIVKFTHDDSALAAVKFGFVP